MVENSRPLLPIVFDETIQNLEKGLNEATRRQAIIAYNVANANTPGFQPLSFDDELNKAQESLHPKEKNKAVVLEEEMAKLTENNIKYASYIRLLTLKFALLRKVVTQGRGG